MDQPSKIRLNKFLAERLGLSRREADDAIAAGKVTVDGQPAILGARIDKNSKVCYNKKIVPFQTDYLYIALNKPVGYVCSRRAQGQSPTIYDLLPKEYQKLKTVGRLDKDSSGLILLTNDGDFAFRHTHPKFSKQKTYEVELDHPLQPLHQQMISDYGIMLDDGPSKFTVIHKEARVAENAFLGDNSRLASPETYIPAGPEKAAPRAVFPGAPAYDVEGSPAYPQKGVSARPRASYIVIMTEGRNRQIRRTFAALGYRVIKLHRTQFGKYQLSGLEPGKYDIIKP